MVIYTSRIAIYGRKIFAGVDIFLVEARFTGSFPLQQACSKVAPAIALYGIDPTNPEDKKRHMLIFEEMGKCQSDRMTYVSRAAFEALQTARRRAAGKGSKLEKAPGSASGSNFSRRDHRREAKLIKCERPLSCISVT
ncbi:hypothetical protein ACFX14_008501 [Malus domestica]